MQSFEFQFNGQNAKIESLKFDLGRSKANIYKINFRDAIKSFIDNLMSSLKIIKIL